MRLETRPQRSPRFFAGNDVDLNPSGVTHEGFRQRPPENAAHQSGARLAEHDLGHVFAPRQPKNLGGVVSALEPKRVSTQALGQAEQLGEPSGAPGVGRLAHGLDCDRGPSRIEAGRKLTGASDDALGHLVRADAGEQAL